jgi:hypothetical protein
LIIWLFLSENDIADMGNDDHFFFYKEHSRCYALLEIPHDR